MSLPARHLLLQVAAQRPGYGEERYERVELQTRVRNAFLALVREARFDAAAAVGGRVGGEGGGAGWVGAVEGQRGERRRGSDAREGSAGDGEAGGGEVEGGTRGEETGGGVGQWEDGGSWVVLDASGPVEEVAAQVACTVQEVRTQLLSRPGGADAGGRGEAGVGGGDSVSEAGGVCGDVLQL